MLSHRWIVIADSPFLPARGGGEREHLGFVTAAAHAGYLALLVVPGKGLDRTALAREVGPVPVVETPRRTSPVRLAHPRLPFVVASRPAPGWLPGEVRRLAPDATGVVAFSYKCHKIGEVLSRSLGLPAVLRQHNQEGAYHRSLAEGSSGLRSLVLHWEAMRIERDDRRLAGASWLAGIADISAADAEQRRAGSSATIAHVPPFAWDDSLLTLPRATDKATGRRVLFLGALDVVTNTTALSWLLEHVWPTVATRHPDAVLDVVGRGPSASLCRRLSAAPQVELHADVPEIHSFLSRSAVALNPAVSGSGVNIKLVDYLQAGVPLVSTSLATRGLPLEAGVHLEVYDDAAGFAAAVDRLLVDPHRAEALGAAGRARIGELLEPSANIARIAELMTAA